MSKVKTSEEYSTSRSLKRLYSYLKEQPFLLFLGLFAIPFSLAAALSQPWLLSYIIDEILLKQRTDLLGWFAFYFFGILVIGYFSDAIYNYSFQRAGQFAIYKMRQDAFEHCLQFPRTYFDQTPTGVLLSRLTTDFEAMGESIATGVLTILIDLVKTTLLFSLLFYLNWQLTLLLIAILLPSTFFASFLRNLLKKYYRIARVSLAKATGYLFECLNGMKTVRLYNAERKVHQKYLEKHKEFLVSQQKSNIYETILFSFVESIMILSVSLILWRGMEISFENGITVGVLIAFINTLQKIFVPIREFAQQNTTIQRSIAALQNIEKLFNQQLVQEKEDTVSSAEKFRSLEFKDVSFRYKQDKPYVLRKVSFSLRAGEKLGLVGATGSGKSTIIRLLSKQYTGYEGSILLNGRELSEIPQAKIQALISIMHQDGFLFTETLKFNIGLDRKEVPFPKVKEAADYVQASPFIETLPGEYDFELHSQGQNLSSGQAQLINFARSIAGGAELVVLDEATGSIDSITENLIEQAIEKIFKEKTVIAIAHRLSTIQKSDQILVLYGGQIVERGTHQELLEQEGYYQALHLQISSENSTPNHFPKEPNP